MAHFIFRPKRPLLNVNLAYEDADTREAKRLANIKTQQDISLNSLKMDEAKKLRQEQEIQDAKDKMFNKFQQSIFLDRTMSPNFKGVAITKMQGLMDPEGAMKSKAGRVVTLDNLIKTTDITTKSFKDAVATYGNRFIEQGDTDALNKIRREVEKKQILRDVDDSVFAERGKHQKVLENYTNKLLADPDISQEEKNLITYPIDTNTRKLLFKYKNKHKFNRLVTALAGSGSPSAVHQTPSQESTIGRNAHEIMKDVLEGKDLPDYEITNLRESFELNRDDLIERTEEAIDNYPGIGKIFGTTFGGGPSVSQVIDLVESAKTNEISKTRLEVLESDHPALFDSIMEMYYIHTNDLGSYLEVQKKKFNRAKSSDKLEFPESSKLNRIYEQNKLKDPEGLFN